MTSEIERVMSTPERTPTNILLGCRRILKRANPNRTSPLPMTTMQAHVENKIIRMYSVIGDKPCCSVWTSVVFVSFPGEWGSAMKDSESMSVREIRAVRIFKSCWHWLSYMVTYLWVSIDSGICFLSCNMKTPNYYLNQCWLVIRKSGIHMNQLIFFRWVSARKTYLYC